MFSPACIKLMQEDAHLCIRRYANDFALLNGKTIFISGATGLIGSNLTATLLTYAAQAAPPPRIIALVRDKAKAESLFAPFPAGNLTLQEGDVTKPITCEQPVDYIIHAASQTGSKAFVNAPVDTINVALDGTRHMLELAKDKQAKGFVYLSTMEVYGAPETEEKIDETHSTNLNPMAVRCCYPESKRLCEALCAAYHAQYATPTTVLRLTQTFGPGVHYDDGRVFADFARCAIEGRDIVLHTMGDTERNYLYTADAVSAIIKLLTSGQAGQAYNAANEETYCSIYDMARLVAPLSRGKTIDVRREIADISTFGYAPTLKMNLDTKKLRTLGWQPTLSLENMFRQLIASL